MPKIQKKLTGMTIAKSYSEMLQYETFEERFRYLKLPGSVGEATFGFDRHINQRFYRSSEWKRVRNFVITRDEGCDLALPGHEIYDSILIHHMNPMRARDIVHEEAWIFDPEYLITTTKITHNAIHYGDESLLPKPVVARAPGDTRLW